ncbi:MAG: response regulator transcription factor [bacterium]|nr:response regulator transcription factor [bacterium]
MQPIVLLSNDAEARRELLEALDHAGCAVVAAQRCPPATAPLPASLLGGDAMVVLDLGREPADSLDWCRNARRALPGLLVCAVTRRPREAMETATREPPTLEAAAVEAAARAVAALEVTALEQGAVAVVLWPNDPRRLAAQLRALQRPACAEGAAGDLALDADHCCVVVDGRRLPLSDGEFELLRELHRHRGQVVTRDALSLALLGRPCLAGDRSLDLRVARLRRKLGDSVRTPRYIRSVRGEGYLLLAPGS